jgi:iron complex transport system ATP-binding protein
MLEWSGVGSTKLNAQAWAKHCAFLPTVVPEPFDETVRSRVARIGSLGARVDAALLAMGLAEFADRRWSTLSSGERQRAWVAFALASDADALLLDEPLAHQDPRERLRLADAFAAEAGQGRLVVITAHDPDWVLGHCTHAIVIAVDGSAAHGPVERILQPQILAAAYAVPWRRVVVDGRHALVAGR